ncbi:hypothetical protein [Micromonospora zamorensis]|uniref:hypothetical protein n=1 Tax=Micromonospora zamorensis TaxID=709883 RepID=UPI002E28890A|nr:hypothetical protein [Micromonospora zamorensis]
MSVTTEALLEAGAVVPLGSTVVRADLADELRARSYRHPALADRAVVRLVPSTLSEAEDLSMEFLGFDRPDRVTSVGLTRQRAVGFPAWVLVHDPANGHHALALVKDIDRLSRLAMSRVGPAKNGFDTLGDRLARSVPHFLPTFYEQAGRAFLGAGSLSYAATMFGKARQAEKTFSLRVDEERSHAVFLEFGLANAVSAQALSAHSRDLAARSADPAVALDRFRRLCVERILGGLPPHATMHADLRRLATAAGLDPITVDRQVLTAVLAAPALRRAPEVFWTAYGPALTDLAADDPAVRGHLLSFLPPNVHGVAWLRLLEATGATAALTAPAGATPSEAEPSEGPAGWLDRFARHCAKRWPDDRIPGLYVLAEQMAPRLVADGVPVRLVQRSHNDVELLDVCLAAGVPVADPPRTFGLPLNRLLPQHESIARDLTAVAADPRFLTALFRAVERHLPAVPDRDEVRRVLAVPGLRLAVRAWLDELADTVAAQGLPTLDWHLTRAQKVATPEGRATIPDAIRRIAGHDLAPALAATLRAGILDEYGWPAFERAAGELLDLPLKDERLVLTPQWPALVLRRGGAVRVVGPDDVLLEHQLPVQAARHLSGLVLRFVDGQLLVSWLEGPGRSAYWSGTPTDVRTGLPDDAFTDKHYSYSYSLALPGGGRTDGGRPLRVGDWDEHHGGRAVTDGTTFWVHQRGHEDMREYDPLTGEPGRESMPAFFQSGMVEGQPLRLTYSMMRVAPEGAEASPHGAADGLIGWRVCAALGHADVRDGIDAAFHLGVGAATADDQVGEGVDGRAFRYSLHSRSPFGGVAGPGVRFPGSDTVHGLRAGLNCGGDGITLWAADGRAIGVYTGARHSSDFAAGTVVVTPAGFWHHLRPRDPAGSAVLRGLSDGVAATLVIEAGKLRPPANETRVPLAAVVELVRRAIPELSNEAMVKGVAGVVRYAAERVTAHRVAVEALTGSAPADDRAVPVEVKEYLIFSALLPFLCSPNLTGTARMVAAAGATLTASAPAEGTVLPVEADHGWFRSLALVRPIMYLAVSTSVAPDRREACLALLAVFADSGLFATGARLRQLTMVTDLQPPPKKNTIVSIGGCRVLVASAEREHSVQGTLTRVEALEYSADGTFEAVLGCHHVEEQILIDGTLDASMLTTFVATARERGPIPLRHDQVETLSQAAGISQAEAARLLAGIYVDRADPGWSPPDLVADSPAITLARNRWYRLGHSLNRTLVGSLVPADPTALWSTGPVLDGVVAWADRRGARRPLSDDLIVMADRHLANPLIDTSELLHGLANPATCRWLAGPVEKIWDQHVLFHVARTLPWLVYHLPPDDPIRAVLPQVVERLRARMADPAFAVRLANVDSQAMAALSAVIGLPPIVDQGVTRQGPLTYVYARGHTTVELHPALLSGPADTVLSLLRSRGYMVDDDACTALEMMLDGSLGPLAVPTAPEYPQQDPTRSVPHVVAEAAESLGVGPDAATLYLQLLALPDPTDRNVAVWTGWKSARIKQARQELRDAGGLVVEAKRPRAGRSLFLPCGWLALKAPHLPVETWKAPLLTMDGQGNPTFGVVVPRVPVSQLFEQAWARVRDGDRPTFEELVTRGSRRR